MTEHQPPRQHDLEPAESRHVHEQPGHHVDYKKIYFTLVVLLVVSVAGPFLEILWVTLITAFGIALVKANLVLQNFMHLRWEKRLVKWVLVSSVALMALFVAGVAPDVMRHEGQNWVNVAARDAVVRGLGDEHAEEEEHVEGETDATDQPVVVTDPAAFNAEGAFNIACATCHGEAGDGAGPAGAALTPSPADFTDPTFWATRDSDRIFDVIKNGAVAVGGSPLMIGWAFTYDDDQIQALTDYVVAFRPGNQ
jgi:caa(3)-type oxidase subunit IV